MNRSSKTVGKAYLAIDDVFSADEVETLRQAAESAPVRQTLDERGSGEKAVHLLLELTRRHPAFQELARDGRLMACLGPLIGAVYQ